MFSRQAPCVVSPKMCTAAAPVRAVTVMVLLLKPIFALSQSSLQCCNTHMKFVCAFFYGRTCVSSIEGFLFVLVLLFTDIFLVRKLL